MDERGQALVKSIVTYGLDTAPWVGENKTYSNSKSTVSVKSVKRLIGRSLDDIDRPDKLYEVEIKELSGKEILCVKTPVGLKTPVEVSGQILTHMKKLAENNLGRQVEGAVITVPAYFDDTQRQATKDAASIAGLNVLRLINEPTAAALAYGLEKKEQGIFMVYDLGGGTFDVSILQLEEGVFSVISTGGDTSLGGDDFDVSIALYLIERLPYEFEQLDVSEKQDLLVLSKELKERLSFTNVKKENVYGKWEIRGETFEIGLNNEKFNELIGEMVTKSIKICDNALLDAGLDASVLKEIVLVGGSTRSKVLREAIAEHYDRRPMVDLNPDHVVCIGAALQADSLIGNRNNRDNWVLLDVNPLSLGIETMGGLVEKIIPRNTSIPVEKMKEFTTFKDGQSGMSIHVIQGERDLVRDCRSLAKFEITDIPPMVAGKPRIAVSFKLDADGLLSVEARETSNGEKYSIKVNPSFGLTEEDVDKIISESFQQSEADVEARVCEEKKLELARNVEALNAALQVDAGLLETEEFENINKTIDEARRILKQVGISRKTIEKVGSELNAFAEPFAQKRMNEAIGTALKGRSVDDLSKN